jgi:uncharacterized glyoxalase superfamily protein PhnB
MNPPPPGWPRIASAVFYDEPLKAIDWLCNAFGFEVRIKVIGDDGELKHSELTYGGGVVMVSDVKRLAGDRDTSHRRSPASMGGGNTQSMMVYVDDVEAHFAHARAAGARIVSELKTSDHGEDYWTDRGYEVVDIGGHHWWFIQRLRTSPKQR